MHIPSYARSSSRVPPHDMATHAKIEFGEIHPTIGQNHLLRHSHVQEINSYLPHFPNRELTDNLFVENRERNGGFYIQVLREDKIKYYKALLPQQWNAKPQRDRKNIPTAQRVYS